MLVILRHKGYCFFFFSNEGNPPESLHVHVRKGGHVAKFWVEPAISLAESYGFTSGELKECVKVIEKNKELIERAWNEHFSD